MANAIPPAMAHALPPAINEFAPFARASVFGDVRDLYRHAPTARIGANYTPSAHARLLERPRKAPPVTKRTGMETNAEILRMPAPAYPSAADMSGRDPKTGARVDPRAAAAVAPLERSFGRNDSNDASSRSFAATRKKSGRDSPDTPFEEDGVSSEHGGSSEEDRASTTDFEARRFSGRASSTDASTTAKRAPFEYTSARRKEIADAMVRYFFYVEHGVPSHSAGESAEAHLAPPKQEWFERTLALVPPEPKGSMTRARFETLILRFLEEMREDQARAARKAVVDYALTDPHERRRLGVEALAAFLPAPPGSALAAERHRRARHAETREGGGARASSRRKERASPVEIGAAASSHFAPSPYVSLPLGWSASVDDARFALERRLRVNTWHALELARDWHAHHAEEPLCDVTSEAFTLGLPYEADAFDAFQKAAFERAKNGIWDSWRAKSMAAFKTRPPAPANASRLGGGDVYEAVQLLQNDAFRQDCAVAAELHGLAALDSGLRKVYVVGDSGSGHTVERDLKACYRISKHKIRVN